MKRFIKQMLCSSLLCAGINPHYNAHQTYIYQNNLDYHIRRAAQEQLSAQGFGPYNIPDRLHADLEQKLNTAKQTLQNLLMQRNNTYLDIFDISTVLTPLIQSFIENLRSLVHNYQLDAEITNAIRTYMNSRGINPDAIPAHAYAEYTSRIESIKNNLHDIMYKENRSYVCTYEIEKTIRDHMTTFIGRIRNTQNAPQYNWWDFFFNVQQQIIPPYQPSPSAPLEEPIQQSFDTNKIMHYELEQKILDVAYSVLRSHNIDPDKVPARVVADYSEKIQAAMRRLRDTMNATGRDHVWKNEAEQIMSQELQSVIDKIRYRGEQCSICLENYRTGQRVGLLSCGHVFHKDCVYNWLNNYQKTCPLCRANNVIVSQIENVP